MLRNILILATIFVVATNGQFGSKLLCYYDSKGAFRTGQAKFENNFLAEPLQFCTHLIYGFAGINHENYKIMSLNEQFDVLHDNFRQITNLKRQIPGLRVLLSVGGGRDTQHTDKYLTLLESSDHRATFISSAQTFAKLYGFDGVDLAWEFPENKPKKIRSTWNKIWSSVKHTFVSPSEIDPKHAEHKEQFTALVREMKNSFRQDGLILSMSVLPNVNSTIFHDVRQLIPNLDFINLWAFDYYTPERNPKEADFTAPLHEIIDRKFDENANHLVQYWLQNGTPNNKLNLGIPTFARTWKMTVDSGLTGVPPISDVKGPGEEGQYTKEMGLLSYHEICTKLFNPHNRRDGYVKVTDPAGKYVVEGWKLSDVTKRYGSYAFKLPNSSGDGGLWIGYDDIDTVNTKVTYVRSKGLGGVAVCDLTLDDFRGLCSGDKYPILRAIKSRL